VLFIFINFILMGFGDFFQMPEVSDARRLSLLEASMGYDVVSNVNCNNHRGTLSVGGSFDIFRVFIRAIFVEFVFKFIHEDGARGFFARFFIHDFDGLLDSAR